MSKRPSLGPETVVRKSRLAAKGEAVPALVSAHPGREDQPAAFASEFPVALTPLLPVQEAAPEPPALPVAAPEVVESPEQVVEAIAAPVVVAGPVSSPEPVVHPAVEALAAALAERERLAAVVVEKDRLIADKDNLIAEKDRLSAEKDRLCEQVRADLLRLEHERLQERAAATRELEQMSGQLVAADATVDELRNRVGDMRVQLDASRAEVSRLIEHHAAERQRLFEHHKAESERLLASAAAVRQASSPVATVLDSSLQSAKRWLFGDEPQNSKPPSQVNQKATQAQQRPTAQPQKPSSAPGQAKPSVVKPVGPPTAPKILNRRPVG